MKKADREIVFNKYGGKCAYCGCDLQKGWHVDHVEPIRRGWRYKLDDKGNRIKSKTDGYYAEYEKRHCPMRKDG